MGDPAAMAQLQNDRFLRALLREPVDRTPLWMMRQAGRYLPEYRATRAQAGSFMDLCTQPELACEVTMQPLRRYNMDAVALIRRELDGKVPLIGFSGSPWTLATYMVEGGSSKDFAKTKSLAFNNPSAMHQLLEKLADAVAVYLTTQVEQGAQALQIFDTWGGALSHSAYQEFSLRYMQSVIERLPREADGRRVPVIVFTKGGGQWLERIAECGADAVGLDWTTDIGVARARIGDRVALQGNMDPTMLNATPERIREEVTTILQGYGSGTGHVFNLGHGVTPGIDPECVAAMVDAVIELSPAYHS